MRTGASATKQSARSRRLKRLEETQEIQIRTTHRRRKLLTRGGVLAGFGMAMVVYPIMGTITPYAGSVGNVPGVIVGQAPSTAHAVLGDGPALTASTLPLPSPDGHALALEMANVNFETSQHLPDCDPTVGWSGSNGELTADSLCEVWSGHMVRADAAVALAELNHRYKLTFGRDLCLTSGYRTLGQQYVLKRRMGALAATPGKSFHGYGLAIDLCGPDYRGANKDWLEANAAAYGWINPEWAKTRIYEPWHWEYFPGTDLLDPYGSGGADTGDTTATGGPSTIPSTTVVEEEELPPASTPSPTREPTTTGSR